MILSILALTMLHPGLVKSVDPDQLLTLRELVKIMVFESI